MSLDGGLDTVRMLSVVLERILARLHPLLGGLAVAVEELQLETLVELLLARFPRSLQIVAKLLHLDQLVFDILALIMIVADQVVAKVLELLERLASRVYLVSMLLYFIVFKSILAQDFQ